MAIDVPNLRKLFAASRTEEEERTYSRTAFYNLLMFVASVATFSFIAQHVGRTTSLKALGGSV